MVRQKLLKCFDFEFNEWMVSWVDREFYIERMENEWTLEAFSTTQLKYTSEQTSWSYSHMITLI